MLFHNAPWFLSAAYLLMRGADAQAATISLGSATTANGDIILSFTLDAVFAVDDSSNPTQSLVVDYFRDGCNQPFASGDANLNADTPTVSSTTATIANDIGDVINAINANGGNLPTSGSTGTTDANYCIQVTLCDSVVPSTAVCPIADILDISRADITLEYTLSGTDMTITSAKGSPHEIEDGSMSDMYSITAFLDTAATCDTTPVITSIQVENDFYICVKANDAAATSILSIESYTLTSASRTSITGTPDDTCNSTTDSCGTSVAIQFTDNFAVDDTTGVATAQAVTGSVTVVLVMDGARRERRLSFQDGDMGEVSDTFVVILEPKSDECECGSGLLFIICWFFKCILGLF